MTRLPLHIICLAIGCGLVMTLEIRENAVFVKTNDVSWTRSTWTVAMTLDLRAYQDFMNNLTRDVDEVLRFARRIHTKYDNGHTDNYVTLISSLEGEVQQLFSMHQELFSMYTKNKFARPKRGLFNFFGSVLQFLTGTATESDIASVRRSIKKVSRRQEIISHVIEDSITVLNVTRETAVTNRNAIKAIITAVDNLDHKLGETLTKIEDKLARVDTFYQAYLHLDFTIQELREIVLKGSLLYDHLQIQLNALSLSHLTPSVIQPFELTKILKEIRSNLPPLLKLPFNIENDIWQYYKYTSCSGIVDENQIVMILKLPLLHELERFEIYKVVNIPLPILNSSLFELGNSRVNLMSFQLEGMGLAINKERTRYAILSQDELISCSNLGINYCQIKSAIYAAGLSTDCVINLFLQNKAEINKYCQRVIHTGQRLPKAQYIGQGAWIIVNTRSLRFALTCTNNTLVREPIKVNPPIDVIKLPPTCSASGDFMNLNAYYNAESKILIKDDMLNTLKNTLNISGYNMWKEFSERIPHFNKTELPKDLHSVRSIPLESLIDRLRLARRLNIKRKRDWPKFYYVLIGFGLTVLVSITVYVIVLKAEKLRCTRVRFAGIKRFGKGTSKRRQAKASRDEAETNISELNDIPLEKIPSAPKGNTNTNAEYVLLYPNLKNNQEVTRT